MPNLTEELLQATNETKKQKIDYEMEKHEINPYDEEFEEKEDYSPINESMEQLDKSIHKLTGDIHLLFSKLEPYINTDKLKDAQQSKPKEKEHIPPKSIFRDRINTLENYIKKINKDLNRIIASLEL